MAININEIKCTFEEFITKHQVEILNSFHPYFQQAFWEMMLNGGKRFRPLLLFSIVMSKNPNLFNDSLLPALALEVTHTYSLIHDDLPCMDNANLRRNHPTLHVKYSEASAVLIGDGLNTYTYYLLTKTNFAPQKQIQLINNLSFASLKMLLGQANDCYFEQHQLPLKDLEFIHINKTAYLIASSLEMGQIIIDEDPNIMRNFGLLLGLFFQIRDDIIDATKDSKEAGKTTQKDGNKNSFVNLLGLNKAKEKLEEIKLLIHKDINSFNKNISNNLYILLNQYF